MLGPYSCRMLSFVKFVISDAMSTSRMRDSDAVRFSWYVARLVRRCSRRFWTAPKFARAVDTFLIASSIVATLESAPVDRAVLAAAASLIAVSSWRPPVPLVPMAAPRSTDERVIFSPLLAPTWKLNDTPEPNRALLLNFV